MSVAPLLIAATLLVTAAEAAEKGAVVAGVATVIDGDTIDIHGERFRIEGIDAPESSQQCFRGVTSWPCGRQSSLALDEYIRGKTVHCTVIGQDRYRRNIGECTAAGVDIANWMVQEGWAVAYRKYSMRYVPTEDGAHRAGKNMWSGQFEAPWDFRHHKHEAASP